MRDRFSRGLRGYRSPAISSISQASCNYIGSANVSTLARQPYWFVITLIFAYYYWFLFLVLHFMEEPDSSLVLAQRPDVIRMVRPIFQDILILSDSESVHRFSTRQGIFLLDIYHTPLIEHHRLAVNQNPFLFHNHLN